MNRNMFKETVKYAAAMLYRPFIGSGRRVVLCYHSLRADAAANFRRQMQHAVTQCRIVKPSEILTAKPHNKTIIAVTFDDAFESFYEHAVPVLKDMGIDAGVFVPTGYIGQPCGWPMPQGHPDRMEKVIGREKLTELQESGIEIFSHTMTHPELTALSNEQLSKELVDSKKALEEILGNPVTVISYPHGGHDRRVIEAAGASGYKLGFTIRPECVSNTSCPLAIGRFVVSPYEPLSRFRLKACGAYAAENVLRKMKHRLI